MNQTLSGQAVLASLDGWITLNVQCETSGILTVTGVANDNPSIGNKLQFEIKNMDQSFFTAIIDDLAAIDREYPFSAE